MDEPVTRSTTVKLLLILAAALALRAWSAAEAPAPQRDAREYEILATSLAEGRGFSYEDGRPTAFRPPGYPAFLALTYMATGNSRFAAKAVDCLLGMLTCLLLFFAGRKWIGEKEALWAAGLWALNPLAFDSDFGSGTFNSETFIAFLLPLALFLIWLSFKKTAASLQIAAGACLALAILTKSSLLLLPAFLAPLWLLEWRSSRARAPLLRASLVLGTCAVCLLPWMFRNYQVFQHRWAGLSTNGGITFFRSNNPSSDGGHTHPPGALQRYGGFDEVEKSRRFYSDGMAYLSADKARIPWLVYRKTRMLLDPFYSSRLMGGRLIYNIWYAAIAPLSLLGVLVSIRKGDRVLILLIAFALLELWVATVIFHGYPRYRFPYEPLLLLWAGTGIPVLFGRAQSSLWVAALALLYLVLNVALFAAFV
jgi:4-amino-4-deoxy-L-arabinose transferase-like glycosyltransferase